MAEIIVWQYKAIRSTEKSFKVCNAWDIMFENRNAFTVNINNYPIQAGGTLVISSQQPGKRFTQAFAIDFGTNAGLIYAHWTENVSK